MRDQQDDQPDGGPLELVAYRVNPGVDHDLIAAPVARAWMDATPLRFANRCLPLLIANQAGWLLMNPETVTLTWDGTRDVAGVSVVYEHQEPVGVPRGVISHFGQGIVTWHVPYLFRTPPGWNLLARGPSNCPKDGIYALDGVVETDWSTATFTMNWQLTRPGLEVRFEAGEPYAMLVPQRRGELESFLPSIRPLQSADKDRVRHEQWATSRLDFNDRLARGEQREGPG